MQLLINSRGGIRCIYAEDIPLAEFGRLTITRGSYVEPDAEGTWFADLAPVGGPRLGPFDHRKEALIAETHWLEANWLMASPRP